MAFIAEGPGAQLFMLLMGVFFALSSKNNFVAICKRTFYLFVAAYLLNLFKFIIPNFFGWLPQSLLNDLSIVTNRNEYMQLLLIGDILHFAAIATLILFVVSCLPYAQFVSLVLASLVCLLSPFTWDLHSSYYLLDYLLQLSGGGPPQVFFPLFPWLVYPLVGFSLGILIKKSAHHDYAFWLCRDLGWILIIAGNMAKYISVSNPVTPFYRTYYDDTMIHLGIVLITLSVWEWISENVKPNHFFDVLTYMSRNITSIYIIQWIIICWLLRLFGYHELGFITTLFAVILTSSLTISISFFFKKRAKKENPISDQLID